MKTKSFPGLIGRFSRFPHENGSPTIHSGRISSPVANSPSRLAVQKGSGGPSISSVLDVQMGGYMYFRSLKIVIMVVI